LNNLGPCPADTGQSPCYQRDWIRSSGCWEERHLCICTSSGFYWVSP